MLHHRLLVDKTHPYDVESRLALVQAFLAEEKLRGSDHPLLLAPVNGVQRAAKPIIGTSLHLDEDDHVSVQSDEIKLTCGTAVVPFNKPVAFLLQIPFGEPLSFLTQELLLISRGHLLSAITYVARLERALSSEYLYYSRHSRTGLKLKRWIGDGPYRLSAVR
jgi:hypothetical protein